MAYLSGIQVGKQPNKGMSAVIGFGQGLYKGIQDQRQHQAQQARLALAQQEMMLRQKAMQHGLDQEKQVQDWSRKFGEYQAWRAGSDDELAVQGPAAPKVTQAPGGVGPPMESPGDSLPSVPNTPAIDARLAELARSIPDAKTRDAFLEAVREEEMTRTLRKHQDRIAGSLNDRILNNSYSRRLPGGVEDPSGSEAAAALLEQVKNADPSNPQEMAQLLDYIEQEDQKLRVGTVAHNVRMMQRDALIANTEQQIMGREGAGVNMGEAKAILEAFKGGLVDEKQLGMMLPDALNGTLALKMQTMQYRAEIERLQLELTKRSMMPGGETGLERALPPRLIENPFGGMNRTRPRDETNGVEQKDRARMILDQMGEIRKSLPDPSTQPEGYKPPTAAQIRAEATATEDGILGGGGTDGGKAEAASEFLARIQAGEFENEDSLQAALKEAGLTEADIEAVAK